MSLQKRNAVLLGLTQFCFLVATSVGLAFSGLAGAWLAPDKSLSTLPFLLITVTTALTTLWVPRLIRRLGARPTLALGAVVAASGGMISVLALLRADFALFCLGNACMGVYQASAQYYRYIAADNATPDFRPTAIAYVLSGGVLAALCGPALAARAQNWIEGAMFGGSYAVASVLALCSLPLIASLRVASPKEAAPDPLPARPLGVILSGADARLGLFACVFGFIVMAFVMTASPFAVTDCGYSAAAAAGVIQWHLLGMYAPSLASGRLIRRFGARRVVFAGLLLGYASLALGAAGRTLPYFHVALALIGVAWNLMYVGGTSLLVQSYRPGEKDKVQACVEFTVFGAVGCAVFLAGWVQNHYGWDAVLRFALLPLGAATAGCFWTVARERRRLARV